MVYFKIVHSGIMDSTQPLNSTGVKAGVLQVDGIHHDLKWGENTVGRSQEADVTINSSTVSRFHVVIR